MSNPFRGSEIIASRGRGGRSAGGGGAGSAGAAALPMPGNLQFWFDFTDISTLFQDVAGTIPVTAPGQSILHVRNKGNDPVVVDLRQPGPAPAQEPLYLAPGLAGESIMEAPPGALPLSQLGDNTNGTQSGAIGLTMAMVARRRNDTLASVDGLTWGNFKAHMTAGPTATGFWEANADGMVGALVSKAIVIGEWIYSILSLTSGTNVFRVSGAAEVSNADPYIQITGFGNFLLHEMTRPIDYAETLIWDIPFNLAERDGVANYFVGRYGAFPQ